MKIGTYTLEPKRPALMGIVNVTPDSFSDGGELLKPGDAIDHALQMESDGADIIDIGGESSRPGSLPVDVDEELERVIPVIEGIRKQSAVPISIDTTKSAVARRAIEAGADMINDISAGRFDPEILSISASTEKPICLMHMKGTPETMQNETVYDDVIVEICTFLERSIERAERAGIGREKIVIDPGIGFGKTAEDNIEIIRHLNRFADLDCPLLLGTSRKSFIGKTLNLSVKERLEATLATIPASVEADVAILRLHDIKGAKRFLDMYMLCRK